jgi:glutaredoxin
VLRPQGYAERAIFVVDKQGVIRYVDVHDIDLQPDNEVLFGILQRIEPILAAEYAARQANHPVEQAVTFPVSQPAAVAVAPERTAEVTLYCTPWCPGCRRVRAFLRENSIPFEEINIMQDRVAAQRVRDWANGKETTPTLDINGTIVVEFDQARVARLLGIKP